MANPLVARRGYALANYLATYPLGDMTVHPVLGLEDQYLATEAPHDSAEEYLEALFMLEQDGARMAGVGDVAKKLGVSPPSSVQMFKRLAKKGLVVYADRQGVSLTEAGRAIGERMVRNGRLMEIFVATILGVPEELRVAHALEHALTPKVGDALCAFLGHPRRCPHGYEVPRGGCCPTR